MASEAMGLRIGELRMADVKAVYGTALRSMAGFNTLVLDADGGMPVTAYIELGDLHAGRGRHRALVCPSCKAPKLRLLARRGSLKCLSCHRYRTRRQLEHHRADWNRRGAREEDELFRIFGPGRHLTPAKLEHARELARQLIAADHARVADLQQRLFDLRIAAEMRR